MNKPSTHKNFVLKKPYHANMFQTETFSIFLGNISKNFSSRSYRRNSYICSSARLLSSNIACALPKTRVFNDKHCEMNSNVWNENIRTKDFKNTHQGKSYGKSVRRLTYTKFTCILLRGSCHSLPENVSYV